jgi:transposase InsO family protein
MLAIILRQPGLRAVSAGRAIRAPNVVDAYTRECLGLEVDARFASARVTRVLDGIIAERGQASPRTHRELRWMTPQRVLAGQVVFQSL